ncbi:MAG: hypothetical protein AMXMBFR47_09710 [Planctomycetota bacterium]
MAFAAFVPGYSGGAVPDSHRIPYSSARNEQADTSDARIIRRRGRRVNRIRQSARSRRARSAAPVPPHRPPSSEISTRHPEICAPPAGIVT